MFTILELDPTAIFLKRVSPHKKHRTLPLILFRLIGVFVGIQAAYLISVPCSVTLIFGYLGISSGTNLHKLSPSLTHSRYLIRRLKRYYDCLKIITQALDGFSSPLVFYGQTIGGCFITLMSYICIRKTRQFPPLFQAVILTCTAISFLVGKIFLPMLAQIYELSSKGLILEKNAISQRYTGPSLKELLKELKGREPCKVYFGLFGYHTFYNKRSTITTYLSTVLDWILTAILA